MGSFALLALLATAVFLFLRGTSGGVYREGKIVNENGEDITSNFEARERQWAPMVASVAESLGVPPDLALATLAEESNGDPQARGSAGEVGLFQLKPSAAQDVARLTELDVPPEPSTDPRTNTQQGLGFLALQKKRWEDEGAGSWWNASRAFRAGFRASMQNRSAAAADARRRMEKAGREDLIPQEQSDG